MKSTQRFSILAVILLGTLARPQSPQGSHLNRNREAANGGWSQLMGTMEKMHTDMAAVEPSGDSDSDFVRLMLLHHQAAIDMAKTLLTNGKNPQIRRLAQEIVTDQQSEIELMQLWLKQHSSSSLSKDQTPALHASKEH